MSAAQHTPGPWEVHQQPHRPETLGHFVTTTGGLTIAGVTYQLPSSVNGKVVESARLANARLIAAAPDLLEALQTLVSRIEFYTAMGEEQTVNIEQWEYTEGSADMAKARAAIAKATGEQS